MVYKMDQLVTKVGCNIKIKLSNGSIIDLPLDSVGVVHNLSNYITNVRILEELSAMTENPVGAVSANSMVLDIISNNKDLIPENTLSPYFGYMNDKAIITVEITESLEVIAFGTWYVESWVSNVSSTTPSKVVIQAKDLMQIVRKNDVPQINVANETDIKQYLIAVIDAYNLTVTTDYRINYDVAGIKFDKFSDMQYINLDTSNMSNMITQISQSTITNIVIDRDNKLKTDYCADDTALESVCTLSDKVQITSVSESKGILSNYDGIKIKYALGVIRAIDQIVELDTQILAIGETEFNNIELPDGIYKVNLIKVVTASDAYAYVSNIVYSKNKISITVTSDTEVACNIKIFGQKTDGSSLYIEKYINNNNTKSILEMSNTLVLNQDVDEFGDEMLKLMGIKHSMMTVSGWINPRIKLGDTVYLDAEASTKIPPGYYKVMSLEWVINSANKCTCKLMKVIA